MSAKPNFWLVVGKPINWHTAFNYGFIWGMRPTQRTLWENLTENSDVLLFYVTAPVSGVVGAGLLRTKLQQLSPLWPEERERNEVIWPLRFEFDVFTLLPPKSWPHSRVSSVVLKMRARAGFQAVEESFAKEILKSLPAGMELEMLRPAETVQPSTQALVAGPNLPPLDIDPHSYAQSLLVEIGRMQKFLADSEYLVENRRLDVVWRRVQRSVPSHVFEVQVSGNLTEAMSKLKQARDLWNSNIYLVGKDEHRSPTNQLLGGPFHEIQDRLHFMELTQVEELYTRKRAYREFENQLGILA